MSLQCTTRVVLAGPVHTELLKSKLPQPNAAAHLWQPGSISYGMIHWSRAVPAAMVQKPSCTRSQKAKGFKICDIVHQEKDAIPNN